MKQLVILLGLVLCGCATASLGQRSTQLQVGMTKDQVRVLFGAPRRTAVSSNGQETWYYWKVGMLTPLPDMEMYASSENRLGVTFKDGKIISWGDQYDWQQSSREIMRTSVEMSQNMMKNMPPVKIEQTVQPDERKPIPNSR